MSVHGRKEKVNSIEKYKDQIICVIAEFITILLCSPIVAMAAEDDTAEETFNNPIAGFFAIVVFFVVTYKTYKAMYAGTTLIGTREGIRNEKNKMLVIPVIIGVVAAAITYKVVEILLWIAIIGGIIVGIVFLIKKFGAKTTNNAINGNLNNANGTGENIVAQNSVAIPNSVPFTPSNMTNSSGQNMNAGASMIPQSIPYIGNSAVNNDQINRNGDNNIVDKENHEFIFIYNGKEIKRTPTIDEMNSFIKSWKKLTGNESIPEILGWDQNPNYPIMEYKQWRFQDNNNNFALISSNVPIYVNKQVFESYIVELQISGANVSVNNTTHISVDDSMQEAMNKINQYIVENYPGIVCDWENNTNQDGSRRGILTEYSKGSDVCRIMAEIRPKSEQIENI